MEKPIIILRFNSLKLIYLDNVNNLQQIFQAIINMHIGREHGKDQHLYPKCDICDCQLSLDLVLSKCCGLYKEPFLLNTIDEKCVLRLNCLTAKAARCDLILQNTQTL